MGKYTLDWDRYAEISRQAAAEGAVLLRNENSALPVKKGDRVAVFGRIQFHYYKSGTGSGGMVNTKYETSILGSLKSAEGITLDNELMGIYEKWVEENPFSRGVGWANEPWSQAEMPLDQAIVSRAAERNDIALVIIGRTAGEDKDNTAEKGGYYLTDLEDEMLRKVCTAFKRVAVVLNVGNIIDMRWVKSYNPQAVIYVWQGGQEGGNAALDALTGKVNPSGRLADTIAYEIGDYPSTPYFGDERELIYAEDIYVGYRYFETVAQNKVMYSFGFGLSYTQFEITSDGFKVANNELDFSATVQNIGDKEGREVVQVYAAMPQGMLGKPARTLIGFAKTKALAPGGKQTLEFAIPLSLLASYDDSGVSGHKSAYVLEAGEYTVLVGSNVRDASAAGSFTLTELVVCEELSEALSPVKPFERMKPCFDGAARMEMEPVPQRTYSQLERIQKNRPADRACTGDKGIKLGDVYDNKASLDDFLDQISNADLMCLVRGEGMCSPKVTPGTGGAYGGLTENLKAFGIPTGCCTDGPSGIRLDCGARAFSMPNGTCLACTFDTELVGSLYEMTGKELRKNRVDLLLGPGINIHRNPLNGRNFEYFSEDPLLTGKMAAAQLIGMGKSKVSGTIKHFAANNQEFHRTKVDSIVSERALREIYLRGFEIAVKEGAAVSIMTSYGAVNGVWSAGNYDLVTTILRGEWGFNGLVMTDWWAQTNFEGGEPSRTNLAAMIRAQNDLYMVTQNCEAYPDNLAESLENGTITRAELLRCAANICRILMTTVVMERHVGRLGADELEDSKAAELEDMIKFDLEYIPVDDKKDVLLDISDINTDKGSSALYGLTFQAAGRYTLTMRCRAEGGDMAQIPVMLYFGSDLVSSFTVNGTNGEWIDVGGDVGPFFFPNQYMRLYFGAGGLEIGEIKVSFKEPFDFSKYINA